jgi:malonate-semialdehyde dehydrogenase (acetylating)/methylmalonate-semialdehyde dehydrogenase
MTNIPTGGVFNVLQGDKGAVDGLLHHPDVRAISFVGSTPIARYIYETAARTGKRAQALGGAKNHMLVLPDARPRPRRRLGGQRRLRIGRRTVHGHLGRRGGRAGRRPAGGEGLRADVAAHRRRRPPRMRHGPPVTRQHRDTGGFWLGPTLPDRVPVTSRAYAEEIFGPVLSVVRVASYEGGVALINAGAFCNGTAIFTNDGGAARRFQR